MTKPVPIKEYSKKEIPKEFNLAGLNNYLKCQNLSQALKVLPDGVQSKSWVGVIKYKNLHLEILPKLISKNANDGSDIIDKVERRKILKNLIFMLSFTKKLDIKTGDVAKLSDEKNPFLEILIREYALSLFDALKKFTPKRYIREEDNLNFLKGKIKFSENIRYNHTNQAKFYCEYDEFSENNLLNQLFLFVSTCLYNISGSSFNKKILKSILNYYTEINLVRFDKFKVQKIKLLRSQELFKKPFNLAKMFVEQTSVDLSKNKFENITLVWDMNKLFEEFIFELIKKCNAEHNSKWKLTAQKGRRLLVNDSCKKRNSFVDILIENDNGKIVLDTKYKKFETENDFSNEDVFQVSTYCLIHNAHRAILLYPQWKDTKPDTEFSLNVERPKDDRRKNDYKIYFKTINLNLDNMKENLHDIQDEIISILNI